SDITAFVDIIAADDVQVRLVGDDFNVDRALNEAERELLLRTLATYEQRGGQLPDNKDKLLDLLPDAGSPDSDAQSQTSDGSFPVSGAMTATAANLRSGPGTDYNVVGQSKQGDILEIVGQSDDGAWYQLDDSVWIAASLVEVAPSNQRSSFGETIVEPYDSPVNPGDVVQWSICRMEASRFESPFQVLDSSKMAIETLSYTGGEDGNGELLMNLYTKDGTLVSTIYQGSTIDTPMTASVDLLPDTTSYVFTAESSEGCWYVSWTATN
ncbi:MAG: SH3 domain-containing protein, partial [Bdellovibrionales bacterium]|nr:SH3 domain-containing protein [Bdellovibrionales bacterium]